MAKYMKDHIICVAVITILFVPKSLTQRPSFAGSRPSNGLNQKDKYHSTTPPTADIANRFGSAEVPFTSNQVPFGQTQKPPVGYPVVQPESVYIALSSQRPMLNNIGTPVVFEDRFGESSNNSTSSSFSSTPSTTQKTGVPLDALGDQLLIDQLNRTPLDKRPFWFINYQAIEAQRNGTANNFASAQSTRGSSLG